MPYITQALPLRDPKVVILLSACLLAIVIAASYPAGGHLNSDEGVYQLMVRDFIATGGPALWNGYEEFPTVELTLPAVRVHDGKLISQYPQLYAVLAAPFYRLLGYDGLFLINALAFAGVVWLTFWLARRLFDDPALALNAALILVFATYAWEYTQATIPHVFSVLWILASFCLAASALLDKEIGRSVPKALGAGLLVGLGVGVRLDTIFVLPALAVAFLFLTPWRPWHAIAVVLGTVPGLAVLAVLNYTKFGVALPFTYGSGKAGLVSGIGPYLFVAVAGGLALLGLWIATRPRVRRHISERRLAVALSSAALLLLILLTPQGWAALSQFVDGVYQLVVDFRARDPSLGNGGLRRGASGSMIYMGGLKKSLLQSCPYLAALIIPIWAVFRRSADRPAICWMLMVPATFIAVYGYFAWHGGFGLNLRYFLPLLPFTSILAAYAWARLATDIPTGVRRALPILGCALASLFSVVILAHDQSPEALEPYLLTLPLVLGAFIVLSSAGALLSKPERARAGRSCFAVSMMAALVWAGMAAFAYDLPKSFQRRYFRDQFTQVITPHIEPDSIVFSAPNGLLYGQFSRRDVRIATPARDDFRDLEALIRFHLDAERPVYLWLEPRSGPWLKADLEKRGIWSRLRVHEVFDHEFGHLVRIDRLSADNG